MSVEIAWVERSSDGFLVRRSGDTPLGRSFVFDMSDGKLIFVVSALDDERISDADIILHIASVLAEDGLGLRPADAN